MLFRPENTLTIILKLFHTQAKTKFIFHASLLEKYICSGQIHFNYMTNLVYFAVYKLS
jgi:hypothetical protein